MQELISLKKVQLISWVYLLVLTGGAWIISSWSVAWSVMAGGLISVMSFIMSQREVGAFVDALTVDQEHTDEEDIGKKSKKGFILKFWLRIFAIGIVLLILIKFIGVNVFGLILGLTTVVFAVTMTALGAVWEYYFSRR